MSGPNPDSEFDPETKDQLLSALSHGYNRCVLAFFRESSETAVSLDELAEYVAEQDGSDHSSPDRVAVRLHHAGLPKLADAGVLDYDPRKKTVRCRDHPVVEERAYSELVEV